MRAMSLVSSEGDSEQNEMRSLQEKLDNTVTLVAQLSGQLAELKEQVECHFIFCAVVEKAKSSSFLKVCIFVISCLAACC